MLGAAPRPGLEARAMILVVDNYDSFTYNLVHYLAELGAETRVVRNDALTADEALGAEARGGAAVARPLHARTRPASACRCSTRAPDDLPILGVCLGHQAIGQAFGGEVIRAKALMHGKTSPIHHDGRGRVRRPARPLHRHPLPLPGRADATPCRTCWRSPPGPTTARSWACSTRPARSTACSSTRNRSPPRAATSCWPTSSTWPACSRTADGLSHVRRLQAAAGPAGRRPRPCPRTTPRPSSPPACAASRRRPRSPPRSPPCACAARRSARSPPAPRAMRARRHHARPPLRRHRRLRHRRRRPAHPQHLHRRRPSWRPAAGLKVAKHGNRALSLASPAPPTCWPRWASTSTPARAQQRQALDEAGICFLFAPAHHGAMRHVAPIRAELGFRTVFNLLGPLSNPAGAKRQVMGVYDPRAGSSRWPRCWARWAPSAPGSCTARAWTRLTTTGETEVAEWQRRRACACFTVTPEDVGLPRADLDRPARRRRRPRTPRPCAPCWTARPGAYRDIVLLNAAAAFAGRRQGRDPARGRRPGRRRRSTTAAPAPRSTGLVEITNA